LITNFDEIKAKIGKLYTTPLLFQSLLLLLLSKKARPLVRFAKGTITFVSSP